MSTAEIAIAAAHRLQQSATPFALVSVIRALAPASARPGDKAVVTADGRMQGWIGGGCAQPAVVRTVRQALADGRARVIRITPAPQGDGGAPGGAEPPGEASAARDLADVLEFGMACHSGGTLELFVDPVLPQAQLVVVGGSPVAASLVQLAPRVGFAVTWVAHGHDTTAAGDGARVIASDEVAAVAPQVAPGAWVVVATQGRRDIPGLRLALALQARQVSFVASATKAAVIKRSLVEAGSEAAAVQAIVAPAGYPMAASTPEEIALSVLAAVVAHRRGGPVAEAASGSPAAASPAPPAAACCGGPAAEPAAVVSAKPSCCGG